LTQTFIPAVLAAYDFGDTRTLVDIGGGHGSVVAAILQKYPQMKGVLFDIEHVVRGAGAYLKAAGVADRCAIEAGDFFQSVPAGGDTYIMKNIIHDWDDERATPILTNIRKAFEGRRDGRVILLEAVIPPGNQPDFGKLIDLEMLLMPGGRERTAEEFASLFEHAGFELARSCLPNRHCA
jgi:hypothetical protein